MKYFIDTEFVEGKATQSTSWLMLKRRGGGLMFGLPKPTIDLISIGIVCEDGREYYAISKDFDLKEAWNRWQPKEHNLPMGITKDYWIRDNVLKHIFVELSAKRLTDLGYGAPNPTSAENHYRFNEIFAQEITKTNLFSYKRFKYLIGKYGKSNKQIAEDVYNFCSNNYHKGNNLTFKQRIEYPLYDKFKPEFYGYYSDYDWVAFCWLFGSMMNLPKGFPMYCIDLRQEFNKFIKEPINIFDESGNKPSLYELTEQLKNHPNYPKQTNEHHALSDAKWNYKLYKFLNSI